MMDIQELQEAFANCTDQALLEEFIEENLKSIRLYFYNRNLEELSELGQEFENMFYGFKESPGFLAFEQSAGTSHEIRSMLVFFASIFERINPNPIFTILDMLPKGSVYFRLKAYMCAYEDVNDNRTHYTENLIKILDYLADAQYAEEEDYTALVISFLVKLYKKVVLKLTALRHTTELELFCKLFKDPTLTEKYHFLSHPLFLKTLGGDTDIEGDLLLTESKTTLYYPSERMFGIFRSEIVDVVKAHPKTVFSQILLGYTAETIRRHIIEYGRADFTTGYNELSADEKTLLYCYFNMRKHFYTSSFVFEKIYDSLKAIFADQEKTAVFIDLGCGPLTSGLALADLHFEKTQALLNINYIGIDISQSMLDKAKKFVNYNIFSNESKSHFARKPELIGKSILDEYIGLDNPIVINASYLFASSSLKELALAEFINKLVKKYSTSNIYFTYQNPDRQDRNQKYLNFKSQLVYLGHVASVERVYYKNNPRSPDDPSAEDVYFEILELKQL